MYGCNMGPDGRPLWLPSGSLRRHRLYHPEEDLHSWTTTNMAAHFCKHMLKAAGAAECQRAYLEGTCVEWLHGYLKMGQQSLQSTGAPAQGAAPSTVGLKMCSSHKAGRTLGPMLNHPHSSEEESSCSSEGSTSLGQWGELSGEGWAGSS